jgi:cytochrome c
MRLTNRQPWRLVGLLCCAAWAAPMVLGAQPHATADATSPVLSMAAGTALARAKTCLGCHQLDAKRVGPSFGAVAQRHGGQQGAEQYLASAIRQGGRGRWGAVPMPAQPQVNPQEALQLAQWILTLK